MSTADVPLLGPAIRARTLEQIQHLVDRSYLPGLGHVALHLPMLIDGELVRSEATLAVAYRAECGMSVVDEETTATWTCWLCEQARTCRASVPTSRGTSE
ncbi:hypothetical protein GCM10012275_22800 [Longimycelium tulufanense]|uniref:Uncharacterized protein n=1 Tax=Longimycelium tulufanense TaxID=907463 RepID=A0A8J3CAM0_9PSEU|nr:hypothetical protein [Longimycelium tulufanense]GGM51299.1 hypothetical protein GCM10012275_22800 [Longimycelium tulufanense]